MKPLMIFDGDCGFCRLWIERWKAMTRGCVDYAPYQEVGARYPQIRSEEFADAIKLVGPGGEVRSGADAVFAALAAAPGKGMLHWMYRKVPGFAPASELFYRLVARNRPFFSWITRFLWGSEARPSTYVTASWLFLRALGAMYLVAFVSLWTQVDGLIGPNGIFPAPMSRATLYAICGGGALSGALIALGVAQVPLLALAWFLYLTLADLFRDFLWFQWDSLLLEMGLLAVFLPVFRFFPKRLKNLGTEFGPPRVLVWLFWWLLFRVVFGSGFVKIMSGDQTWRNFTALQYHYETQPLPTWVGWLAHQLPDWLQKVSVGGMFFIELVIPFLILFPRRAKVAAGLVIVALQISIDLTGNYGFFGWQAVALCLFLFDDAFFQRFLRGVRLSHEPPRPSLIRRCTVGAMAVLILLVSVFKIDAVGRLVGALRSINSYGVFAIMTTERNEIIIEGSDDKTEWKEYEFRWKPGDLKRRPAFVEPHMPRLDWQMWFAALGTPQQNRWFGRLMYLLLEGSPDVLALLDKNPFPDAPPRYLRALFYEYHFTDVATYRATGQWWKRELKGMYTPVLSLKADEGG